MTSDEFHAAIERAEAHALATGALMSLVLDEKIIPDGGVDFSATWLSTLAMKDLAAQVPRVGDKSSSNPFLPFEQDLFVADLSETHVAILSKYQGQSGHLLMITRAFVEQGTPLTTADLRTCAQMLALDDGLVFFNSNSDAGASQKHRHLQFFTGFRPPIEAVMELPDAAWSVARAPRIPFGHRLFRVPADAFEDADAAAEHLMACLDEAYRLLEPASGAELAAYNLLMMRDWLMFVPRRVEVVAGVSLPSLAFAGMIGLRRPDQADDVAAHGPMAMLIEAARPV